MSLEKSVEEKIRQAIADGEFDNLAGAGKPLNLTIILIRRKTCGWVIRF